VKAIQEGQAKVTVPIGKKITRKLEVFYNPAMKSNRDISVLFLQSLGRENMKIADPLAGSGIRAIRFLKELDKTIINKIYVNDAKEDFPKNFKKDLVQNKIKKQITVNNTDASKFLLQNKPLDYIDIDPFGTPNPFLDAAVKSLAPKGILAVTATDTSALCGSYPKACRRKYWAEPLHNHLMHETGLRILIRKVQLIGAQYEKPLLPLFSYAEKHYMRIYFLQERGRSNVDKILKQHDFFQNSGPMWLGKLWDSKLVKKMLKNCEEENKEVYNLLKTIEQESKINSIGFHDTHVLAKKSKLKNVPRKLDLIKKINKKYKASPTHFCGSAIRSPIPEKELIKEMKKPR